MSIKTLNKVDLHKNITALFQDYMKYPFSMKMNIQIGDMLSKFNYEKFNEVVRKSGVNKIAEKFEEGYETVLGNYLQEGVDLSGGQWQKVTLSRTLYRDSQVIILDEPTSALDPQTELDIYNQFNDITRNKTVIFISHRMAAARMADKIIVMKNGRIIEEGNHNELLSKDTDYKRMYNSQAKWYE